MLKTPKLSIATPPGAEPIVAAELAAWLGASETDPLLEPLLVSAREACEAYLGIGLITQKWYQFYDLVVRPGEWWDGVREAPTTEAHALPQVFELGRWPVTAIDAMTFYDWEDNATAVDADTIYLSSHSRPPLVALRQGQVWPGINYRIADAVRIHYTVGFGADGSSVPQSLKDGIKALAAYLYEHRSGCSMEDAIRDSGAAQFWRTHKVLRT
jgi:hypothetical protein